jgi:hypothetical protein
MSAIQVDIDLSGDPLEAIVEFLSGPAIVQTVAAVAYARWLSLANQRLHRTREAYLAGLSPPVLTSSATKKGETISATISLVGQVPNYVENGLEAYDMRSTHLKGRTSRVIRFDYVLPGAQASAQASPLGAAYRGMLGAAGAKRLGRAVAQESLRRGGTALPAGVGGAQRLRPFHKSDLYHGLVASELSASGAVGPAGAPTFSTFRTISVNSDPAAWHHPGIPAHHLMDQVVEDLPELASAAIQGVVDTLGSGV